MRVGQPWCGHWSLAIGACGQGRGRPWAWRSVGGLFVGVDGICGWVGRGWGQPLARTAKGAGVLVALVKIKFKLHPQQLILKLITLYSPHSVIFNDFESLFFF